MSKIINDYDVEVLKDRVVELMKKHHKIPGKISSEEIEKFCSVIAIIEDICSKIENAKICWAYYDGINWSRKSIKDLNSYESYQYYRSPFFSLEYNKNSGFEAKRKEACKKIRGKEDDIDEIAKANDYAYYAIEIEFKKDAEFEKLKNLISTKLYCRITPKDIDGRKTLIIIPYPTSKLTDELKKFSLKMNELTEQINDVSENIRKISTTFSEGFFLGGQRELTHIQLHEDEWGDIEYS